MYTPSRLEYIAHAAIAEPSSPSYHILSPRSLNTYSSCFSLSPTSFTYNHPVERVIPYSTTSQIYHTASFHREYHFEPDFFLKPGRETPFVGKAEEIKEFVEQAFEAIFHQSFPNDIRLSVCTPEEFRTLAPHPSTIGLSINRSTQGLISDIFILNGSLGRVLLTIGHELGHVLTPTLDNPHDEEAKAYAFSYVWMKIIQELNIAGLQNVIVNENPAPNGLHDKAFAFIQHLWQQGKTHWEIYCNLLSREESLAVAV